MPEQRRFRGHAPVRDDHGDWRCRCGVPLWSGQDGSGRRAARWLMRYHRHDLWMASPEGKAALKAALARRTEKADA